MGGILVHSLSVTCRSIHIAKSDQLNLTLEQNFFMKTFPEVDACLMLERLMN